MKKKILVIGSNGQVGKEILSQISVKQYEVLALSRDEWDMGIVDTMPIGLIDQFCPDIIINAAAYTNVENAEKEINLAFNINGYAVNELSSYCAKNNTPLIHISTDYVFDGMNKNPYKESDEINPINIYGKSKVLGEYFIEKNMKEYLILRTSWVFSKEGNNFVNKIISLASTRDSLKIVSDQFGNPTSAHSIAKTINKIASSYLESRVFIPGIFHFSGKDTLSWYEFAELILDEAEIIKNTALIPCSSRDYKTLAKRPTYSSLDCLKIYNEYSINTLSIKDELIKNLS